MCLILFSYRNHPSYHLILIGNRDEFYDRPTTKACFWDDAPFLLAGRDLRGNGTWFGITKSGRFAAITNYRDPSSIIEKAPSRGLLIKNYLLGSEPPDIFLRMLSEVANKYNGFNILVGNIESLYWFSNRNKDIQLLKPGIHGLSNHLLDTPWPKLIFGKKRLDEVITGNETPSPEKLLHILSDKTIADDINLPDTGVGLERERMLSPLFISSPDYGTRSSYVLLIDAKRKVTFLERTYYVDVDHYSDAEYQFTIEPIGNYPP
jgi:uncharacterized protein with NRDE domain